MNSWLQSMKQWTQWLMGEAPLPDGRSRAMLAGTIATISAVAVAVPAVIPTSSSANAAAKRSASAGQDSNSSQYTVPSSTVSPNGAIAAATTSTTTSTTSSGIYVPADPYAKPPKVKHLGKRPQGAAAGSGATTSGGATSLPQATPLIAGAGLLGASGGTSPMLPPNTPMSRSSWAFSASRRT